MDTSILLVADHFKVGHIPAATIPGSRLSNILAQMQEGHRLTSLALGFLQRQELPGLYRLACGELTHEAYIAGLDTEQLRRNQAAMMALKAKNDRESQYRAARPKYNATKDNSDSTAARNLRHKREREASKPSSRHSVSGKPSGRYSVSAIPNWPPSRTKLVLTVRTSLRQPPTTLLVTFT
ncbi:MAG: hypothetical protein IPO75_06620 [Betaproteobacteria bacterium]|nr:hypothetical protein [Betaproteobacteria bacterium]